jgi:hypothetical protein
LQPLGAAGTAAVSESVHERFFGKQSCLN